MKVRNITFAAMSLLVGLPCLGQVISHKVLPAITSKRPNYTITITPPSGPLSLSSPMLVEVFYSNTTNSDIYMTIDVCKTCAPQQILLMKDGKEVETKPFQRMSTGRGTHSDIESYHHMTANTITQRQHTGVFWRFNIDLRTLYNITEIGQYTMTASRIEETKDGKVVVNSNAVLLSIVP